MARTTNPDESPSRLEALTATYRAVASRAAEQTNGSALVFAHGAQEAPTGGMPALRAAAGFPAPDNARAAAKTIKALASDCLETCYPASQEMPGLGVVVAIPIACEDRAWGVLAAIAAEAPSDPLQQALVGLADSAALHTDHAWLVGHSNELAEKVASAPPPAEEKADELLQLSEALFAQDIELLRSNEKLSSVEKLKSDFIEKMSRELRTPLNGIIEAIISVLAGENENLSPTAKSNLRFALDDGTAFLRTLQNILDLWRVKQGELPVEAQAVNFREVVDEAIFSVQDTIGDKPVTVRKHLEEPFPKIRTDLAKINQVLFLLLDNACKFTQSGKVEIEASVEDGVLRCRIEDTGIGICADDREYVFDEFFQVDPTTSSTYRGAGLGLTLVRDLLILLDGEIEIDSEVGQGTQVVFRIPVQPIP